MPTWLLLTAIETRRALRQKWVWNHRIAYGAATVALLGIAMLWQEGYKGGAVEIARRFIDSWKIFHFVGCYLWMAMLTSNSFAGERERAALESIKITTASGFQLVMARFVSRLFLFFVVIAPALPILVFIYAHQVISVMELAFIGIWTLTTILYVGAISLSFSISRGAPSSAFGATILCLAGFSLIPGMSPWHQLFFIDDTKWDTNIVVLALASLIPLAIGWKALRHAGDVLETPYDLVGIPKPSDENHKALAIIEWALVFGQFLLVAFLSTAGIPTLGGFGYLLFLNFENYTIMQFLFLLAPISLAFIGIIGYRILASHYCDPRGPMLMDLLSTPLPFHRCMVRQILLDSRVLRWSFVVILATSVFFVFLGGRFSLELVILVWIEFVAAVLMALAIRLTTQSSVAAIIVYVMYLLGVRGLPMAIPSHVNPREWGLYSGWIALGSWVLFSCWRPSGLVVVSVVAFRFWCWDAFHRLLDRHTEFVSGYSPISILVERRDARNMASHVLEDSLFSSTRIHAASALCSAVYVTLWLFLFLTIVLDQPGYRERLFSRWIARRRTRFGFPFPFR
jgi:hypothetical protein